MNYILTEVNNLHTHKQFLSVPLSLYRDDKHWIRPLDEDIESVFDPKKNKHFRQGEAIRWILTDEQGTAIGRVAAFIHYSEVEKEKKKNRLAAGGMGFFECINNHEAAFTLFDACKEWLLNRGMAAMDGPVNFGERDRWWGLLTQGFTEPNYCMPYNPTYYQELFEAYGFQIYFKQYTYYRSLKHGGVNPIVLEKAQRLLRQPEYHFCHIRKKELEKFTEDFRTVYNKAWIRITGIRMSKIQANAMMKQMKPILDERLMWFGYYNNEPVSFYIMIPEMNQLIKHLNGKLNILGKIKLFYHLKIKKIDKALGMIFGVVPEHQGKGVEAAMVEAFSHVAWAPGFPYDDFEMNWIGDFNPSMMRVAEQVGGKINKTHHTYRKIFDPNIPFERFPILGNRKGRTKKQPHEGAVE